MTTTTPRRTAPEQATVPSRNWMLYLLGAIVILAAASLWWVLAVDQPVDLVEAEIAAANDGDVSAQLEFYAPDAIISRPTTADQTIEQFLEYQVAIGTQITIIDPCEEVSANTVVCTVRHENELFDAAGIAPEMSLTVRFDDDGLITSYSPGISGAIGYLAFYDDFARWMREAHPAVYSQVWAEEGLYSQRMTAETAPIFLQYVDEFVAESEKYPLG